MKFENAYIPLDAAWSSPFVRWQGPAAELSSLDVAAQVTERGAASERRRGRSTSSCSGSPCRSGSRSTARRRWPRGSGSARSRGPLIMQACATSVACVHAAAAGGDGVRLVVVTDRTSNGPHVVYPSRGRAGRHAAERELGAGLLRLRPEHGRGDARHRRAGRRAGRLLQGRGRRRDRAPLGAVRGRAATTAPSSSAGWSRSRPAPSASRPRSTPTGASAPRRSTTLEGLPRRRPRAASSPTAPRRTRPTAARG